MWYRSGLAQINEFSSSFLRMDTKTESPSYLAPFNYIKLTLLFFLLYMNDTNLDINHSKKKLLLTNVKSNEAILAILDRLHCRCINGQSGRPVEMRLSYKQPGKI